MCAAPERNRAAVGLFARAPSSGGKSRLASHIPEPRLLTLRRALLADALAVSRAVDRLDAFVFVTPDSGRDEMAAMIDGAVTLLPQRGADLGERMCHALEHLLVERGYASAMLIGSDTALLTGKQLNEAADALQSHPLVIGPADDGGYYLIGMSEAHRELFEGIEWGSDTVFRDTITRAERIGIVPHVLARIYDIDTIDDLSRAERELVTLPRDVARHLRAWFES